MIDKKISRKMSKNISQVYRLLFHDLNTHSATLHLVHQIMWDLPLTPYTMKFFGISSADHYQALKTVLMGIEDAVMDEDADLGLLRQRIVALDAAYGSGRRLNALVQKYAPEYADRVHFSEVLDEQKPKPDTDTTSQG